jgi:hypothetical protein
MTPHAWLAAMASAEAYASRHSRRASSGASPTSDRYSGRYVLTRYGPAPDVPASIGGMTNRWSTSRAMSNSWSQRTGRPVVAPLVRSTFTATGPVRRECPR